MKFLVTLKFASRSSPLFSRVLSWQQSSDKSYQDGWSKLESQKEFKKNNSGHIEKGSAKKKRIRCPRALVLMITSDISRWSRVNKTFSETRRSGVEGFDWTGVRVSGSGVQNLRTTPFTSQNYVNSFGGSHT